jgi:hypothetical protein
LYNIEADPSEKYEVGEAHPQVIEQFKDLYKKHQATLSPVPSYLDGGYKRK